MSAQTRTYDRASLERVPEPAAAWFLTGTLSASLLLVLLLIGRDVTPTFRDQWAGILFWMVLVVLVNLWPLAVGELTLTLDMPILLAVALLYSPSVAAVIALVAAVDVREVGARVPLVRAVYNRVQVAYCVLAASWAFHYLGSLTQPWWQGAGATLAAVGAFNIVNVGLVAAYMWLRLHSWNRFTVGRFGQFVITYTGYGVIALVLAHLFVAVGAWSVVTFLVPIAVARQALLRTQHLHSVTDDLRSRERLMSRLFDRMTDERRDERMRIASSLHDDVLQSLIRIAQLGDFIRKAKPGQASIGEDARELARLSRLTVTQLREVVSDLQKSPLGRHGLLPTLRLLAKDLELDWRVRIEVNLNPPLHLSADLQVVLYQVAREGLLNALKHANATLVRLTLRVSLTEARIEIVDDGIGFDPEHVDRTNHFGLGVTEERLRLLGGNLVIHSENERGTKFLASVPLGHDPGTSSLARNSSVGTDV